MPKAGDLWRGLRPSFAEQRKMLNTRTIPQYEDEPEDWQRLLYKASRGSDKATRMLSCADMAYMVELTGDPDSPSTLHLDDYRTLFRSSFPDLPPLQTAQEIVDYGVTIHWFQRPLHVTEGFWESLAHYKGVWRRQIELDWAALVNDAVLTCVKSWNADEALGCIDVSGLDYDSRLVVTGMLYLSLTWPERNRSEQGAVASADKRRH